MKMYVCTSLVKFFSLSKKSFSSSFPSPTKHPLMGLVVKETFLPNDERSCDRQEVETEIVIFHLDQGGFGRKEEESSLDGNESR